MGVTRAETGDGLTYEGIATFGDPRLVASFVFVGVLVGMSVFVGVGVAALVGVSPATPFPVVGLAVGLRRTIFSAPVGVQSSVGFSQLVTPGVLVTSGVMVTSGVLLTSGVLVGSGVAVTSGVQSVGLTPTLLSLLPVEVGIA